MKKAIWITATVCAFVALTLAVAAPLNGGDPNCDDANTISDLTYMVDFLFKGGPAPCEITYPMAPIAAGVINNPGEILGGTGNFTCTWDAADQRYVITIDGHGYFYTDYVTHVTPLYPTTLVQAGSFGGDLIIYLYNDDTSSPPIQGGFQFTTYQLPTK